MAHPDKFNITYNIPGGWYGNDPASFTGDVTKGNVTVNPEQIVEAITWLKRRATINETGISDRLNSTPGIFISYHLRISKTI